VKKRLAILCLLSASSMAFANTAVQSSYTAIAVGAREPSKGTGTMVMRISKKSLQDAEQQALASCKENGGLNCVIMQTSANMCSAIAIGKVKDSKKVRLYTLKLSAADKAMQSNGFRLNPNAPHPGTTLYQTIDKASANALQQCQSDPATDPASCRIQSADCALIHK